MTHRVEFLFMVFVNRYEMCATIPWDILYLQSTGHDTLRALFLMKKGAFSKNRRGTSFLLQILGGKWLKRSPPGTGVSG